MNRFTDQVAIVTGGAGGIGTAVCERLGREGAAVAVLDLNREGAERLAARLPKAMAIALDVTDETAVDLAVQTVHATWGRIDLLVNNAGGAAKLNRVPGSVSKDWLGEVDRNLNSAYYLCRAVLPHLIAAQRGSIVNVASVNGLGFVGNPAYSAAKAGLINLTQSLASQHGRDGVRVNVVCPGTVRTQAPGWQRRLAGNPGLLEQLAAWYPLGRVGRPEDIAGPIAFLASEDAAWITGAVLPVDGGLMAGHMRIADEINEYD